MKYIQILSLFLFYTYCLSIKSLITLTNKTGELLKIKAFYSIKKPKRNAKEKPIEWKLGSGCCNNRLIVFTSTPSSNKKIKISLKYLLINKIKFEILPKDYDNSYEILKNNENILYLNSINCCIIL